MKKKPAYATLTAVIDQMVADNLDKNTIQSLRDMLDLDAFQPIRDVIENKIIEIGNYLKAKEVEKQKIAQVLTERQKILKDMETFLDHAKTLPDDILNETETPRYESDFSYPPGAPYPMVPMGSDEFGELEFNINIGPIIDSPKKDT